MKGDVLLNGAFGLIGIPRHPLQAGSPQLPVGNPIVMDEGDYANALGLGLKARMPKETASEKSAFLRDQI